MRNDRTKSVKLMLLAGAAALLLGSVPLTSPAYANEGHGGHHAFSAGEPGDPMTTMRTVNISMREADGAMLYVPNRIEVRQGEEIRFVVTNDGVMPHEFVLASTQENLKHAELMKKYPDMEHDDPNSKTLQPHTTAEVLWRFSKRGEFEFACLIPGHREAGMLGKIVVK